MNDQLHAVIPDYDPETVELLGVEEIPHSETTNAISQARRIALQILYETDTTSHPVGEVITAHLEFHPELKRRGKRHLLTLVHGVQSNQDVIDRVLEYFAPEWPVSQVAVVDRNILRIALFEIGIGERAPIKVIISEAVELANLYGADRSTSFVNGVLGAIQAHEKELRQVLTVSAPEIGMEAPEAPSEAAPQADRNPDEAN